MTDPRSRGLASSLDRLVPIDAAEAAHRQSVLTLLAVTPEPFSADQFDPGHVTGSVMVVAPGRAVLLIHHPTLGRWLQPGGHVDPDDRSVADAAAREAREETGLEVELDPEPFDVDVHPIPARRGRPVHQHFDVRFVGLVQGLSEPRNDEGILTRWCTLAEALQVAEDVGIRRMLGKLAVRGLLGPA